MSNLYASMFLAGVITGVLLTNVLEDFARRRFLAREAKRSK